VARPADAQTRTASFVDEAGQLFETQVPPPPVGMPPLLGPASIGRPPEVPPLAPIPPRRSRQQCVAGLQVESHGAPAWISLIFESIFWKSPAHVHAGAPPEPLVDPPLDEVVDPELDVVDPELVEVDPPELDVLPPLDVVEPAAGLLGGSVWELSVLVPLLALGFDSSPGMSEADSAHARTSAEARRPLAARTCTDCSFMAAEYRCEAGVKQARRLHRKNL
jgi:hypothetical protein